MSQAQSPGSQRSPPVSHGPKGHFQGGARLRNPLARLGDAGGFVRGAARDGNLARALTRHKGIVLAESAPSVVPREHHQADAGALTPEAAGKARKRVSRTPSALRRGAF